jgi:FkbH-like protein
MFSIQQAHWLDRGFARIMSYLVFRNHTVEHLFMGLDVTYAGYGDLLHPTGDAKTLIWFYIAIPQADVEKHAHEIESYSGYLERLIDNNPGKSIIAFLLSRRFVSSWIHTDQHVLNAIDEFNSTVIEFSQKNKLVKFIDIDQYFHHYSVDQIFDWKYFLVSQMVLSPEHSKSFKNWFSVKLKALSNLRKKCLVLDLDNTLWGGVVGEDGVSGIKLGDVYPGLAYRLFQESILEMKNKGVILAICSKNNIQDVEEVWQKHPSMYLKRSDFSSIRINWENKANNVQEIAQELNIGIDSMVFIDDNPAERELVSMTLPNIEVPQFPEEPYGLPGFIEDIKMDYFQAYNLTTEDLDKAAHYGANAQRAEARKVYISDSDYLRSLEMKLKILPASEFTIDRIAQMTQKTNQFNLTTKRYLTDDIQDYLNQGHRVYCLNVKDKFGDNGITALAIILVENNSAFIDTFLLSCRIIGRGIEKQFLTHILNKLFSNGVKHIGSKYIPTKKNMQAAEFYDSMGFSLSSTPDEANREYDYEITSYQELVDYYEIIDESDK